MEVMKFDVLFSSIIILITDNDIIVAVYFNYLFVANEE